MINKMYNFNFIDMFLKKKANFRAETLQKKSGIIA